ncbi:hypothetical protein [Sphingobacterium paucimobilis]|uniref:Uncharacterized protein n=1 Tax=Sphingobacterium paucimobilis HER1398 TaxID=1346330 RepID=U2JDE1_9SPHI|nr:hypothetical protein [Sphingobacterium paucimobilis]ERJ60683.1 hypothetical protein M472_18150 [Sphingobacterium paucimobilis HER1398]
MKRFYTAFFLAIVLGVGFSACSKNSEDAEQSENASLTMKVDGEIWGTTINNLFTEEHEYEGTEYYLVLVGGQRIAPGGGEDDVSSISMHIAIPKSRLNNPKGTYQLLKDSEANIGQATASYIVSTEIGQTWYASYDPGNPTQAVGTVEITGFEVGEQKMVGYPTGNPGYTRLSGTFKMNVYPIQENGGSAVKITEGKFNLKSGLGFDFK